MRNALECPLLSKYPTLLVKTGHSLKKCLETTPLGYSKTILEGQNGILTKSMNSIGGD